MTLHNPFPGMNPFLEKSWPDVHTKLIGYIADSIAEQLPPDLSARSEERVVLSDDSAHTHQVRADVAVIESWKQGIPPQWQPHDTSPGGIIATQPRVVIVEDEVERWIEITDAQGTLITVIEVLSPTNKLEGAADYRSKARAFLAGGVSLVEIDLLRAGRHVVAVSPHLLLGTPGTRYLICVSRSSQPGAREIYECPLRDALPNIRVPLRAHEPDAILPLQPLIDRCYRMGSYWNLDHRRLPGPALDQAESAWVKERVEAGGIS